MLNGNETDEEAAAIVKANINATAAIKKIFNIDNVYQLRKSLFPKSLYSYNYVVLDTNNKAVELSNNVQFGWRVISNGAIESGAVSCVNDMRNIVGMRIFPVSIVMTAPVRDTENINKVYVNKKIPHFCRILLNI